MKTICLEGSQTSAIIYAKDLDDSSRRQILQICDHPAFAGSPVRIMPDVHAGKGCVIGFTAVFNGESIVPNLIGVDIGCGVLSARMDASIPVDRDYLARIDEKIRMSVPHGFNTRTEPHACLAEEFPELLEEMERISKDVLKDGKYDYHARSIGTLGGGNHFIEISRDSMSGDCYLHVHSGSRNFGNCIAEVYQNKALEMCQAPVPEDLRFLEGEWAQQYMRDMKVAQWFARVNRRLMVRQILDGTGLETFDTIHNYISEDNIIRKGAVSAAEGEILLVPLNMRDGSLLCRGKGNPDYNCSSPHGAGRVYSRNKARKLISMDEYAVSMEGVYTTCVSRATLDEAPMAYKDGADIEEYLEPTAGVIGRLKSVYNFKAS